MEISKQSAENIISSQIVQASGDANITINNNNGVDTTQFFDVCLTLYQRQLDWYTQQAEKKANERYEVLSSKLDAALHQIDQLKLKKITEPSIQIAARETYEEFISSGEEFLGDELIDLLIERMSVEEHTSQQIIIDEARRVIPKLTRELVDVLALKTFMSIILSRPRLQFADILKRVADLGEKAHKINSIDVALLKQTGCATDLVVREDFTIPNIFARVYDPFFRRPVPQAEVDQILNSYPEFIQNPTHLKCTPVGALFLYVGYLGDDWYYKISNLQNLDHYKRALTIPYKAKILAEFDAKATKMTEAEIQEYLLELNKNWEHIITLFNKNYIRSLGINPLGHYIGLRRLNKVIGWKEIPLTLFYPEQ